MSAGRSVRMNSNDDLERDLISQIDRSGKEIGGGITGLMTERRND